MIRIILRRVFHAGILVFISLSATFFIVKLAPGDPLNQYYSPEIDPRLVPTIRHQLGLDSPLHIQYGRWLWNFLGGNFGFSFVEHRPVSEILKLAIPRTLQLTVPALLLEIILGVGLGMLSAAKRYTLLDKVSSLTFLTLYSIPTFYLAYLLITVFSLKFHLLPSANMFSLRLGQTGFVELAKDRLLHMAMPVFVLSFGSAAALARYTRGSVLEVIGREFIRTARAKGLSEKRILWLHAFRNALAPVLTVFGLSFPFLLGGSVVVEKVFAWPGMGALMVDSIFARDYPVVLATSFIAACMVIAGNLLADISYGLSDPRIKIASFRGARG